MMMVVADDNDNRSKFNAGIYDGDAGGVDDTRERRGQSARQRSKIQYGYRRSRRRTAYEYGGSSSLSPAQIMEQETYYRCAKVAVQRILYILQIILLHQALYVSLCSMIGRWSDISSVVMVSAIASAWLVISVNTG